MQQPTMRVWLVDDPAGQRRPEPDSLEALLRQLAQRPGSDLSLVGTSPFRSDFAAAMGKLAPDLLDLLVVNEQAWPENAQTEDMLRLGLAMVLVTAADQVGRFRPLAELYPVSFVPLRPGIEALWLALVGALAGKRRQAYWQEQVARLQQRLEDRRVIEQAKAILIQGQGLSEAEAYNRLRIMARQQRRRIRDIAQALLDAEPPDPQKNRPLNERPPPGFAQKR